MSGHTRLTRKNFYSFFATSLIVEASIIAFGTIDMLMIAPFGSKTVGAVGYSELLLMVSLSVFSGVTQIFSKEVAALESAGESKDSLGNLTSAVLICAVISSLIYLIIAMFISPVLNFLNQPTHAVAIASTYLLIKTSVVPISILYGIMLITMRLLGSQNFVLPNLIFGLILNATLNYLVLYTNVIEVVPSEGVAFASVFARLVMLFALFLPFYRLVIKKKYLQLDRLKLVAVKAYSVHLGRKGIPAGIRNLNDYATSLTVALCLGTLGDEALTASAVASKIISVFYRVPQAFCTSCFTYYSYFIGKNGMSGTKRRDISIKLVKYSAVPTAILGIVTYIFIDHILTWFIVDVESEVFLLSKSLVMVYLLFLPCYFTEHMVSNFLCAEYRTKFMMLASAIVVYFLVIPGVLLFSVYKFDPASIVTLQQSGITLIAASYSLYFLYYICKGDKS